MQNYLPLAGFFISLAVVVFLIALIAFEVVHLIWSSGWHWKRSVNGCLEAFVFLVICFPVVIVVSMFANWMCRRFDMRHVEEIELEKVLSVVILDPFCCGGTGDGWCNFEIVRHAIRGFWHRWISGSFGSQAHLALR